MKEIYPALPKRLCPARESSFIVCSQRHMLRDRCPCYHTPHPFARGTAMSSSDDRHAKREPRARARGAASPLVHAPSHLDCSARRAHERCRWRSEVAKREPAAGQEPLRGFLKTPFSRRRRQRPLVAESDNAFSSPKATTPSRPNGPPQPEPRASAAAKPQASPWDQSPRATHPSNASESRTSPQGEERLKSLPLPSLLGGCMGRRPLRRIRPFQLNTRHALRSRAA